MTTIYTPAPEVETVAERLIKKQHRHLAGERVEYLFRDKAAASKGKTVLAKARLVSGLNAFLATPERFDDETEPFFVLEVAEPCWRVIDAHQREALVDHELRHMTLDEDGKRKLVGHDLEEFAETVRIYGMWRPEVEKLVKAAYEHGQGVLSFDGGAGGGEE